MTTLSLQQMVHQVMAEADRREKIASAGSTESDDPKKKGTGMPTTNPATSPERNEESIHEKTSSAFVEKLASAVDYCNRHFFKAAETVGAGTGPNTTETNLHDATDGEQSEETGQATSENIPAENPPSGVASPGNTNPSTSMQTTINDRPGGEESWANKDILKQSSAKVANLRHTLSKMAGHEPAYNHVEAVTRVFSLIKKAGDVPPDASASEEGVPSQPSETSGQKRLIHSNDSAIDYTKRDAKAVPKERMGEVLSEPAQKKSTDPVLHNNLEATDGAGVKISSVKVAAARALLRKVAQEGTDEHASSEQKERAAKLQAALDAKDKEKNSQGMGMGGGMGGGGMSNTMPVGGGF